MAKKSRGKGNYIKLECEANTMDIDEFESYQNAFDKYKINEIYNKVIRETKNAIIALNNDTFSEEILENRKATIEQLNISVDKLNENIMSLYNNSEWNTFTIGFYGETNAGKSTLIEVFRIIFNEETKIRERKEFEKAIDEYSNLVNKTETLDKQISKLDETYSVTSNELKNNISTIEQYLLEIQEGIEKCNSEKHISETKIEGYKETFFSTLKNIIHLIKEYLTLRKCCKLMLSLENKMVNVDKEIEKYQNKLNTIKEAYDLEKKKLNLEQDTLNEKKKATSEILFNFQDGNIIGDGRSDFTQKCALYKFEKEKMNFALLDLPGIEGKENIVINEIRNGLEKAHLIFYISSNCYPPQKGEENNFGTLEKIKQQLSQQTEVYFVFNKRAKNVRNLKENLINDEEKLSLIEVDNTLKDILQENYSSHLCLSAYPAFLSLANVWDENNKKAKENFLNKYTKQEILKLSQIDSLIKWFDSNVLKNCKQKIWKSNYNKINTCVKEMIDAIDIVKTNYCLLINDSNVEYQNTSKELSKINSNHLNKMKNDWYAIVDKFKTETRNEIYLDIDTYISNSDFEYYFERILDKNKKILIDNIKKSTENEISKLQIDVENTVKKFEKYMQDILEYHNKQQIYNLKFKLNINIKSNVNMISVVLELVIVGAGIVLNGFNPITLIGGAVSAVIVIGKALFGFFNHSYRASEQKKSVNQNLNKIEKGLKNNLDKQYTKVSIDLNDYFTRIKGELYNYIKHQQTIIDVLDKAENNLKIISKDIEKEGDLQDGNY